ncbi:ATP-binding protein, partial [Streptomyces hainanensis]
PARAATVSAGPVPRQLPPPPPSFVGRTAELAALTAALEAPGGDEAAAVPITAVGGVGGVGKTSLALRWAHDNLKRFPDGQLYANLRGFDPTVRPVEPAAVVATFLTALGVDRTAVPTDPEAGFGLYRSLVADRRVLVLLDNARDAAQVRPLLPGSPSCVVVVTSRSRLGGLLAAEGAQPLTLGALSPEESRRLLATRLGAGRTAVEPAAVGDIVASCARLPLALAVAAARAAAAPELPLGELAAELRAAETRLDALDAGDLATSLRAVCDTSYDALDPTAGRLLCLLGTAPGSDIGVPAAASLAGLSPARTRSALRALEAASLVDQHTPGRFRAHDLLRLYAAERAARELPPSDRDAALRRLVDHHAHTALRAGDLVDPHSPRVPVGEPLDSAVPQEFADRDQAMAWFETEHGRLLPLQRLAADHGMHRAAWLLAWGWDLFLSRRGHLAEHLASWHAGLAAATPLRDPTLQGLARRRLAAATLRADPDDRVPLEHLGHALALFEDAGDVLNQAHTHQGLSLAWHRRGDVRMSLTHAEQALALYRTLGDALWEANALNAVGWWCAQLGDHDRARESCRESLAVCRAYGHREGEAAAWDSLGYVASRVGRHAEALDHYREALALRRALGDTYEEADVLGCLAEAHLALGDPAEARATWHQALALYRAQHRTDQVHEAEARLAALEP